MLAIGQWQGSSMGGPWTYLVFQPNGDESIESPSRDVVSQREASQPSDETQDGTYHIKD
jgi:hypothetical protein